PSRFVDTSLDAEVAGGIRRLAVPYRGLLEHPGKYDLHHGAARRRAFQLQSSTVVLHDLLCNRKPQPGAVFLAVADERLEQFVTDGRFYAGAVVYDANLQSVRVIGHSDGDVIAITVRRLAGIQ